SKPIVWWDETQKRWTGYDIPDVPVATDGPDTPNGLRAFHMNAEGVGRLFAAVYADPRPPSAQTEFSEGGQTPVSSETALEGLPRDTSYVPKDGPLPEMYDPAESPVETILHPKVKTNPLLKYPRVKSHQPIGSVKDFPYILMTSTVAEHWCAGSTTRNLPWLNELVPEPMVEMPASLAT